MVHKILKRNIYFLILLFIILNSVIVFSRAPDIYTNDLPLGISGCWNDNDCANGFKCIMEDDGVNRICITTRCHNNNVCLAFGDAYTCQAGKCKVNSLNPNAFSILSPKNGQTFEIRENIEFEMEYWDNHQIEGYLWDLGHWPGELNWVEGISVVGSYQTPGVRTVTAKIVTPPDIGYLPEHALNKTITITIIDPDAPVEPQGNEGSGGLLQKCNSDSTCDGNLICIDYIGTDYGICEGCNSDSDCGHVDFECVENLCQEIDSSPSTASESNEDEEGGSPPPSLESEPVLCPTNFMDENCGKFENENACRGTTTLLGFMTICSDNEDQKIPCQPNYIISNGNQGWGCYPRDISSQGEIAEGEQPKLSDQECPSNIFGQNCGQFGNKNACKGTKSSFGIKSCSDKEKDAKYCAIDSTIGIKEGKVGCWRAQIIPKPEVNPLACENNNDCNPTEFCGGGFCHAKCVDSDGVNKLIPGYTTSFEDEINKNDLCLNANAIIEQTCSMMGSIDSVAILCGNGFSCQTNEEGIGFCKNNNAPVEPQSEGSEDFCGDHPNNFMCLGLGFKQILELCNRNQNSQICIDLVHDLESMRTSCEREPNSELCTGVNNLEEFCGTNPENSLCTTGMLMLGECLQGNSCLQLTEAEKTWLCSNINNLNFCADERRVHRGLDLPDRCKDPFFKNKVGDDDGDGIADAWDCDRCVDTPPNLKDKIDKFGCAEGQKEKRGSKKTCEEKGGIYCGSLSCPSESIEFHSEIIGDTLRDGGTCCIPIADNDELSCSAKAFSPSTGGLVDITETSCNDPDGDGIGFKMVTYGNNNPIQEACTTISMKAKNTPVPFFSNIHIIITILILGLFYFYKKRKN